MVTTSTDRAALWRQLIGLLLPFVSCSSAAAQSVAACSRLIADRKPAVAEWRRAVNQDITHLSFILETLRVMAADTSLRSSEQLGQEFWRTVDTEGVRTNRRPVRSEYVQPLAAVIGGTSGPAGHREREIAAHVFSKSGFSVSAISPLLGDPSASWVARTLVLVASADSVQAPLMRPDLEAALCDLDGRARGLAPLFGENSSAQELFSEEEMLVLSEATIRLSRGCSTQTASRLHALVGRSTAVARFVWTLRSSLCD